MFKKIRLFCALLMLGFGVSSLSFGQTEANKDSSSDTSAQKEENPVEEVIVTGIRGSLNRAMDIKRDADNLVDAISAEDLGKFPDQNLAESLQRVPGVSIDRNEGEGQFVSVRGLGPEFNAVLLNGRALASIDSSRSFSFNIIAAELVSGTDVHKSPLANMQEGSLGATVDIKTHRPLEMGEFKAAAGVEWLRDNMSGESDPQFSGLISNTYMDGRIGVLLSFSSQQRRSRTDEALTFGYLPESSFDYDNDGNPDLEDVYMPRNYDQIVRRNDSDRDGGNFVFQYQANEKLRITFDALYSKYSTSYREDVLAHWFEDYAITSAEIDARRTVVRLTAGPPSATDYLNRLSSTPTTTRAYGFNFDWDSTENLTLLADISYSKAERNNGGNTTDTVAGFFNNYTFDNTGGTELPSIQFDANLDPSVIRPNWVGRFGDNIVDDVTEVKLGADWKLESGALKKIGYGVFHSDRTKSKQALRTARPMNCLYCGYPDGVDIPDNLFSVLDAGDGFLSGVSGDVPNEWLVFNSNELFAFLESDAAIQGLSTDPAEVLAAQQQVALYDGFNVHPYLSTSYDVNEQVLGAYIDFDFRGEMGDKSWMIYAGIRYVETDVASSGYQFELVDLEAIPNTNLYQIVESDDWVPVTVKHNYNHVLPTMNAKLNLTEDWVVRAAYSETITRPTLSEMYPKTIYFDGPLSNLEGWGGNPKLVPFESTNIDLALEWYYSKGAYVSVSAYRKDIDNFIEWRFDDEVKVLPSGEYDYRIERPRNVHNAKIDGYELAIQHSFTTLPTPWDGLGFFANMTFVDSESSANTPENPLKLPGLGDSHNLVLFYEKNALEIRIAYNNRLEFMQSADGGEGGEPIYVDDYSQIDLSANYEMDNHFSIFFGVLNLTKEYTRKRGLFENHTISISDTGPRYFMGLRGKF